MPDASSLTTASSRLEEAVAKAIYEIDPLQDPEPLTWDEAQKYQHVIRGCYRRATAAIGAIDRFRNS